MRELAATSQEKRRFNRTMRQIALVLALGLAVGAIFYGNRNSGQVGDVNAKVDQIDAQSSARVQRREDQDACAAKINAAWSAAFGQAAVAPVGSPERTRLAL
jgi:type VI protein secretion system component VasK